MFLIQNFLLIEIDESEVKVNLVALCGLLSGICKQNL